MLATTKNESTINVLFNIFLSPLFPFYFSSMLLRIYGLLYLDEVGEFGWLHLLFVRSQRFDSASVERREQRTLPILIISPGNLGMPSQYWRYLN
jgi:hypothetical protein